jgi:hypothetical protein
MPPPALTASRYCYRSMSCLAQAGAVTWPCSADADPAEIAAAKPSVVIAARHAPIDFENLIILSSEWVCAAGSESTPTFDRPHQGYAPSLPVGSPWLGDPARMPADSEEVRPVRWRSIATTWPRLSTRRPPSRRPPLSCHDRRRPGLADRQVRATWSVVAGLSRSEPGRPAGTR